MQKSAYDFGQSLEFLLFFFFQAEDGIRDWSVTGVQTVLFRSLAVGVIIGAAFGKIVDSLVKQILMPFVGLLLPGEQGYLGWKIAIGAKEVPYGLFLGELVNFVIVALALYLFIVKFLGFMMKARQSAPPVPSKEELLLAEIRDLLRAQRA